jgi:hypothetical protein
VTKAVNYLRQAAPNWVAIQSGAIDRLDVLATPIRAGGVFSRSYALLIEAAADTVVEVREDPTKALLPSWCPERHINPDGSFCLGLQAGVGIGDSDQAVGWWRKLELYLDCQEVAHKTGRWPAYAQLSHGSAGEIEIEAERIAASLNSLSEYQQAVRYGTGPLADAMRLVKRDGLVMGSRSVCLCGYVGKHGRPLTRGVCRGTHRDRCLLMVELKRRRAVDEYWNSFLGSECCGSMKECPLRRMG